MPALATLPAVPVAAVGRWATSTGVWDCTAEELASAVAAEKSGLFRTPIIKLGHRDPRFTTGEINGDGTPAVGRVENLRLNDDGTVLLGDLVGLPAWLAEIAASAYPSRSIEAYRGVEASDGSTWPMVMTGLALLGVEPPAVETLADLADLYGVSRQVEDYVAAARIVASALPEGDPMPLRALGTVVAASASIDELTRAAEKWAEDQPAIGEDAWVRDIYTDHLVFSVWRGDDVTYWSATWAETGDGAFTFGTPEQVRPTYEPVPAPAAAGQGVAAGALLASRAPRATQQTSGVAPTVGASAVPSARGRESVTAGDTSQEQHVPLSPAVAEKLGVPVDADDETVLAAVEQLRTTAPEPSATEQQEGGTTNTAPTAEAPDVEALVNAAAAKIEAKYGAVIASQSAELAAIKAEKAAATKAQVIGDAVAAGKISPAQREQWEADYDEAPAVTTRLLGRMEKGSAVPLSASGHTGGEVAGLDDEAEALYKQYLAGIGRGGNA